MTVEASSPCCCQQPVCCNLSSVAMSYIDSGGLTQFDLVCSESGGGAIGQGVKLAGTATRATVRASTSARILSANTSLPTCRYVGNSILSSITGPANESVRLCDGFNTVVPPIANGLTLLAETERIATTQGPRWFARGRWIYLLTGTGQPRRLEVWLTQYSTTDAPCPIGLTFEFNAAIGPAARFQGWNGSAQFDFTPSNLSLAGRFVFA